MPEMVPHGTLDFGELAEWGYQPEDLIVFSSNINPYGPPSSVVQAVADSISPHKLASYPDRLSLALRQVLADHHHVPADAILVGNGTADIMWLLALVFMRGKRVGILSPTFGEYANAAHVVGVEADLVSIPGWHQRSDHTFEPDDSTLSDTITALSELSPDVIFLCNPNSPTGEHLTPQEVESLLDSVPNALWIIDEAYTAFTPEPWSATQWCLDRNIIVLHSMTKDFALGGLRLGYAAARPELIQRMVESQPPWNVNAIAQIAGIACMEELVWRKESVATLRRDTERLRHGLMNLGFSPRSTTTNYMLVPVSDPSALRNRLLAHRIVVRDCTSFGLPTFIRLATQRPEDNQLLLGALVEVGTDV